MKTIKEYQTAVEARQKALEKEWLKDAREVVNTYECAEAASNAKSTPFNILYANTETLLPSLYNSTPRPDVSRRYTTLR